MSRLKAKAKAFGFNARELQGIARHIADNLSCADDASDEDVNAEIDTQIEAVLPLLEFGRSYANRVINDSRNEHEDSDEDGEEASSSTGTRKKGGADGEPAWFRVYREQMEKRLSDLQGARTADTRRARLEKLLADTGSFGSSTLRGFERMSFATDEDFEQYCAEVEEDLKSLNKERSTAGLGLLGAPAAGSGQKKEQEPEVLTQEQIKTLVSM